MRKPTTGKSNIEMRRRQALESGDPEYHKRRNQLFEVAGEIFRQKGFGGASMNDFAQAIGIDRASIYYYISGKEELFQQLVHMAVRGNVAMVEEIRSSNLNPKVKMESFIVELMKSYGRHFPYLYLYVQEDMARVANKDSVWAREMKSLSERFDAAMIEIIEEGVAEGMFGGAGLSAKMISLAIIGMCNWSHRWYFPDGEMSAEEIGEKFSQIVLNGILVAQTDKTA
mgnify:CR=1 FL=1